MKVASYFPVKIRLTGASGLHDTVKRSVAAHATKAAAVKLPPATRLLPSATSSAHLGVTSFDEPSYFSVKIRLTASLKEKERAGQEAIIKLQRTSGPNWIELREGSPEECQTP